jgi:hypothetical protein
MRKSVVRARVQAAGHQEYRCYYCDLPMWARHVDIFMAKYGVTRRQAMQLRCTAEHLVPKSCGGLGSTRNIVAACAYCNRKRHARPNPLEPDAYREFVQRRMQCRRWLLAVLPDALRLSACVLRQETQSTG